jgi:hypothetical protein
VDGRRTDRGLFAFYAAVALIALAGQTGAAVEWLHWLLPFALAAVAAVEFGGIVLSAYADHRRRLGERAYAARVLSAAVAAGAVAVNWLGHHDHLQGGFFAGMSALGYGVWLLHSGARRRDQLRAVGDLPPVAPVYGWWLWLRHPGLTRRARALALADPKLGLYGSLDAARTAVRTEQRQAAIAALLRRKLAEGRDPLAAEIAVAVYDLDEIAGRLAAGADYDGLTALIAAELTPARLADDGAAGVAAGALIATGTRSAILADRSESASVAEDTKINSVDLGVGTTDTPAADLPKPATSVPEQAANLPVSARSKPRTSGRPSGATQVAKIAAKMPTPDAVKIAAKTGLSLRTVRRHLAALPVDISPDKTPDTGSANLPTPDTTPVNGAPVPDLITADQGGTQ